jgi:hypothetical protein
MENNTMNTNSEEQIRETQNVNDVAEGSQSGNKQTSISPAIIEELKASQSLGKAVLGGLIGSLAGAILWAIITALTKYQIGYMAIAVGFLTGFMVKKLGQGFEQRFAYIGAIWSLIGCFLGNILAVLIMVSNQEIIPFMELLPLLNIDIIVGIVKDTFSPMDLLFYGIAVYEGYRFSLMTKLEVTNKLNKLIKANSYSL